jgi:hypothetical protein
VLAYESFNCAKFVPGKTPVPFQLDGVEPELGFVPVSSNVDVRRLVEDVIRVEVEPIWPNSKDSGHVQINPTYRKRVRAITTRKT